jgi:2-succinyl-5-enolpyruvyl-6-hydroxy-3-cyclohexene-1-carboxylate synthase
MELAQNVLEQLLAAGVKEFCLCPGARNSPFVVLFEENPQLKSYTFFEERSAAFFALGRIAATRNPVAIITTSGTAAAELLPAAVEATYSSLPLIMITADRPKRYRGTGAPQCIEQVGLFSYYIEASFDLDDENTHMSLRGLSWKKPTHINVCFAEPLLDGPTPQIKIPLTTTRTRFPVSIPLTMVEQFHEFLQVNNPLVILSTIPERARDSVLNFLTRLKAPIYAEGISGLRTHPALKPYLLKSSDRMLHKLLDEGTCNAILRIGGVPTVRLWRDLEDRRGTMPVFSFGFNHYTGLSRQIPHFDDLDDLGRIDIETNEKAPTNVFEKDEEVFSQLDALLEKHPTSEQGLVRGISKLTDQSYVYLGNSLPIREWDFGASYDVNPHRVVGNRGANGIDGQVSTFLGWCREGQEHWAVIGDLTAMYDLSALWVAPQLPNMKIRIVVLNNGGGQIFFRMFKKELFLNKHDLSFESWAKMWGWGYSCWDKVPENPQLSDKHIIEVRVDTEATKAFWTDWDQVWKQV